MSPMDFWRAQVTPHPPVVKQFDDRWIEISGEPTWAMLPPAPTTWIPFEQTGAALIVARVYSMRSIGVSSPLAILARDVITARTLPADSFERAFAVYDKLCMEFEAQQLLQRTGAVAVAP